MAGSDGEEGGKPDGSGDGGGLHLLPKQRPRECTAHGHAAMRAQEWSYMRGGLSTIDRDYGLFNKVHHDIGTHVVHHLFPQIPHYHLTEATEARSPPSPPARQGHVM